eukprot:m.12169 g.12169  ORF g.12169 m.12169 type:complete len:1715 (+) comp6775_c0_seq1:780-5924(+)
MRLQQMISPQRQRGQSYSVIVLILTAALCGVVLSGNPTVICADFKPGLNVTCPAGSALHHVKINCRADGYFSLQSGCTNYGIASITSARATTRVSETIKKDKDLTLNCPGQSYIRGFTTSDKTIEVLCEESPGLKGLVSSWSQRQPSTGVLFTVANMKDIALRRYKGDSTIIFVASFQGTCWDKSFSETSCPNRACDPVQVPDLASYTGSCNSSASYYYGDICTLTGCPVGHQLSTNETTEMRCGPTLAFPNNETSCQVCPIGYFTNDTGPSCYACVDSYQDQVGQTECKPCLPGTYSEFGASQELCPAGSFCNETNCHNRLCPKGFFQPEKGQTQCLPCAPGTFADELGSRACLECDSGSYASANGTQLCTLASFGHFVPEKGATQELPCEPGTYAGRRGLSECQPCNATTVQPESGAASCRPCKENHFREQADTESLCPVDMWCNDCQAIPCTQSADDFECLCSSASRCSRIVVANMAQTSKPQESVLATAFGVLGGSLPTVFDLTPDRALVLALEPVDTDFVLESGVSASIKGEVVFCSDQDFELVSPTFQVLLYNSSLGRDALHADYSQGQEGLCVHIRFSASPIVGYRKLHRIVFVWQDPQGLAAVRRFNMLPTSNVTAILKSLRNVVIDPLVAFRATTSIIVFDSCPTERLLRTCESQLADGSDDAQACAESLLTNQIDDDDDVGWYYDSPWGKVGNDTEWVSFRKATLQQEFMAYNTSIRIEDRQGRNVPFRLTSNDQVWVPINASHLPYTVHQVALNVSGEALACHYLLRTQHGNDVLDINPAVLDLSSLSTTNSMTGRTVTSLLPSGAFEELKVRGSSNQPQDLSFGLVFPEGYGLRTVGPGRFHFDLTFSKTADIDVPVIVNASTSIAFYVSTRSNGEQALSLQLSVSAFSSNSLMVVGETQDVLTEADMLITNLWVLVRLPFANFDDVARPSRSFLRQSSTSLLYVTGASYPTAAELVDIAPPTVTGLWCNGQLSLSTAKGNNKALFPWDWLVSNVTDNSGRIASIVLSVVNGQQQQEVASLRNPIWWAPFHKDWQQVQVAVTDAAHLTTFCSFQLRVEDHEPPQITCQPVVVPLPHIVNVSLASPTDVWQAFHIRDNVDDPRILNKQWNLTAGQLTTGTHFVNMTVADQQGNVQGCTAQITIVDDMPPRGAGGASCDQYLTKTNWFGTSVNFEPPLIEDNDPFNVSILPWPNQKQSGDKFASGKHSIYYNVSDSRNTITCTTHVRVSAPWGAIGVATVLLLVVTGAYVFRKVMRSHLEVVEFTDEECKLLDGNKDPDVRVSRSYISYGSQAVVRPAILFHKGQKIRVAAKLQITSQASSITPASVEQPASHEDSGTIQSDEASPQTKITTEPPKSTETLVMEQEDTDDDDDQAPLLGGTPRPTFSGTWGRFLHKLTQIKEFFRRRAKAYPELDMNKLQGFPQFLQDEIRLLRIIYTNCGSRCPPGIIRLRGVAPSLKAGIYDLLEDRPSTLLKRAFSERPSLQSETQHIFLSIAHGVLQGLEYVHQSNIVHRDIAMRNILLDFAFRPYLTDFGLSAELSHANDIQIINRPFDFHLVGPEEWDPVFMDEGFPQFGLKSDIWAVGVFMVELWRTKEKEVKGVWPSYVQFDATEPKWNSKHCYPNYIRADDLNRPEIPHEMPRRVAKIVTKCWAAKIQQRPSAQEVRQQLEAAADFLELPLTLPEGLLPQPDNMFFISSDAEESL